MLGKAATSALLVVVAFTADLTHGADVFNMGGRRDASGVWIGPASLEFVAVGNEGNPGEWSGRMCGAVSYRYQISKFEVTAGQYTAFLNAVAASDTYGLYDTDMINAAYNFGAGCHIQRTGEPGSYSYSVPADWTNRPVNFVNWGDAVRFVNWLSNGQPFGPQGLSTTEDGSYYINGATTASQLLTVKRKANAVFVIPSEDEWYKAAYYDPDKAGGAGYWDFATKSDTIPSSELSAIGTNNVNYLYSRYAVGSPYFTTEVGALSLFSQRLWHLRPKWKRGGVD